MDNVRCSDVFFSNFIYVFFQELILLGTICFIQIFTFFSSIKVLHVAQIRFKLKYTSVFRNNLTLVDSSEHGNITRNFSFYSVLLSVCLSSQYDFILENIAVS
jgi:hypothetical protein